MLTRKLTYLAASLLFLFSACSSDKDQSQANPFASIEIPALLDRAPEIRYEKEWEMIQNAYAKYLYQIRQGEEPEEGLLRMAQLFTMEARTSGEHGHYYPGALKILDILLQKEDLSDDLRFMALSTQAGVQLSQHDFSQGLKTGQEAVKMNPYNAQIYGVLVDASVELGQYEQAVSYADQMVAIRPDLRSYSRVSYLREIYGRPEGAVEAMLMAVSAGAPGSEESAWTRLKLGELYQHYGELAKARATFEQILAERPDYPFAIAALAHLDMEAGDLQAAEAKLDRACKIIPEFSFYEQLALIYKKTGREEAAQEKIQEVLLMLEDDVLNGHNMNLEYAKLYSDLLNDQDQALKYAQNEYQLRPDNITVNLLLADIYHARGEMDLARQHIDKASVTNSKDPELLAIAAEIKS
ncbi:MAG: hypothetical protein KDC34_17835 [Saprospiraceae bacterium]|nr:hypothetical protein [Saprospiraceae bacterium]